MEITSSPDADFSGLATRTLIRSTKEILVFERRRKEPKSETKVGKDVAEEFEKEKTRNTLSEEKVPNCKKEEGQVYSRTLLQAQVEEGQKEQVGPHHHPRRGLRCKNQSN
ncbi:hypothetical protein Csa_022689 [Cucumis sativus]|uniref:Uncharacterized protein n=1 Tax=Cucumis sativus TaxID=3659 RepID=A0A0A0LTC4_CUCSA|nr:hypothetical protein Csa_022689 [Cucumis sativus]